MPFSSIISAIAGLILFIGILVLTYFVTKFIGKKYPAINSGSSCIRILDRARLGQDRDIVLVQIADATLLLGVTSHTIEKLADINPALLPDDLGSPPPPPDFQNMLQTIIKNKGFSTGSSGEKKGKSDDRE